MPLIKPRTRGKQILRHIARLDRENSETLHAYAAFLGESTDYVLNQVIDTVLAKRQGVREVARRSRSLARTEHCQPGTTEPRHVGSSFGLDSATAAGVTRTTVSELSTGKERGHATHGGRSPNARRHDGRGLRGDMGTAHASGGSRESVSCFDRREGSDGLPCPHVRLRDHVVFDAVLRCVAGAVDAGDRCVQACPERQNASAPALPIPRASPLAVRRTWRGALSDYAWPRAFAGLADDPAARALHRNRDSRALSVPARLRPACIRTSTSFCDGAPRIRSGKSAGSSWK